MANFEGHPERYTFGKLTMERGGSGEYTVWMEGIDTPVASVTPYGTTIWMWLHFETGRSAQVTELAAAGEAILAIEATRS